MTNMIRIIPTANWTMKLVDAIEASDISGDRIVVHNEAMKELAERAISRMCPYKEIELVIVEDWDDD